MMPKSPLFKYIYIISIITVLSAPIIAGCSRPKPPETLPTRPREALTVTMSLGEQEWKVFRSNIFPPFEKEHNAKIKAFQIESGQLATKLEALQIAGKSEIDLFAQDNMSLAMLVNKDLVLDLSDQQDKISDKVLPSLIEACKFDGRLLFMPFRPNVQIIYYNSEAFEKYGLYPPETWDDLFTVAKTFKAREGVGRFVIKAYGGNPTATQVYEFILQAGGNPYAFNDEGCLKAFQFLKKLSPYLSPESQRAKWDTVNDILAKREAYLASNWPFGVPILIKDYGLDFIKTYSGFSGPSGEYHVVGGDVFGVPKNVPNKEEALNFIFFMQSREIQETLASKLGWPSIREDAYADVQDWQKPHFRSVKQALKHGVFRKNVTWWPAYKKYINLAFKEIVMQDADVKQTLDKYKAELEEEKKLHR